MGITRQIVFCTGKDGELYSTQSFSAVADGNSSAKAFVSAYVPPSKGTGVNPEQETIFVGTTSAVGKTYQIFRNDLALDDGATITGSAITRRIDPEARIDKNQIRIANSKRYHALRFHGQAPNLTDVIIEWTKDVDPTTSPMITWEELTGDSGDIVLEFESGLAEWVHLRVTDTGTVVGRPVFNAFAIVYYPLGAREDIET